LSSIGKRVVPAKTSLTRSPFVSPIDVILTPHDVVQPDVVVVANPLQASSRGIEGAPLLVIEVLSPTIVVYDRTTKAQRYAALGIPHYWIVDPGSRRVECYRLERSVYHPVTSVGPEDTLTHPDFPAIQFSSSQLWP
jgi:Uma2 family endonuclease